MDAFYKYFFDVKPHHTKLLEVFEMYKFAETIEVDIEDSLFMNIKYANTPLCKAVGWGVIFDNCGFSNDNCCDLFQCLGGYGLIWDNSDRTSRHQILEYDTESDTLIISGNYTFDRRVQIVAFSSDSLILAGDATAYLETNKIFIIAPFNVHTIVAVTGNKISVTGDVATEMNTKQEMRIRGSHFYDRPFGIRTATYDENAGVTVIEVAGNVSFNPDMFDSETYMETESSPQNQGFYTVGSYYTDINGDTIVTLKPGKQFPAIPFGDMGSVQFRTGLLSPRYLHLKYQDGLTAEIDREHLIVDCFYEPDGDRTHVVLGEKIDYLPEMGANGSWTGWLDTYGYMTNAGFDNNELCDVPKPTNVHAFMGESLKITHYVVEEPVELVDEFIYFTMLVDDIYIGGEG
jgi:hypothetical protein